LPRKVGGHDPPAPMGAPPLIVGDLGELCCAHLNGEWQFHSKFHGLVGAFLACPPD